MKPAEAQALIAKLTPREKETLFWITKGCTWKEIAVHMGITKRTVEFNRKGIADKLGVTRNTEAAFIAGLAEK